MILFNFQNIYYHLQRYHGMLLLLSKKVLKSFNNEIPNLTIETIDNCRNSQFDFKIALGSLIKFFYKEKFRQKENLIQTNIEMTLNGKIN